MEYDLKKKAAEFTKNKYETVIIAAKVARKINLQRLAAAESLGDNEAVPKYKMKVTTEALKSVADGKIKYRFRDEKSQDEEMFPEM